MVGSMAAQMVVGRRLGGMRVLVTDSKLAGSLVALLVVVKVEL